MSCCTTVWCLSADIINAKWTHTTPPSHTYSTQREEIYRVSEKIKTQWGGGGGGLGREIKAEMRQKSVKKKDFCSGGLGGVGSARGNKQEEHGEGEQGGKEIGAT